MKDIDKKRAANEKLTYEEMQELASHEDVSVRCLLAQREDIRPEILYYLAEDEEMEVRRHIALNPATPRQADLLLASDRDEGVRLPLTEKIAKLAPDVSEAERDKIQALTYEALMVLSRDQAIKVRQILSETLKDVDGVPCDVIRQLASDMELVVSGPVLQFSPVLSDEDLLEIISSTHAKGALNAISKRAHVSESVSDAVISTNERSAIADLLGNKSAQIREEALDLLAERAHDIAEWHVPLVKRPQLSSNAAKRMAHYLADNLLKSLEKREDLDDAVIVSIKKEVKKRIECDGLDAEIEEEEGGISDPIDEVRQLDEEGKLDEEILIDWIDESQWQYVIAALSVLSKMRRVKVKKIISSQSAKGMMALAWRAGIPAYLGESLQFKLAKMPIGNILKATQKGEYPLTDEELSWHLELFGED
ncbi:hypothetical protein GCM10011332_04800 [Terasakiella brassicae]|uniref:DUF2336 domain-containing protein n=1 Tax=Terasakiella brassicae TaxID=1634917 RepID=A0A917F5P6_9PROT|nr:DUF2336 domain-containing protein [Terasakiella brassicae]GGF54436.1 hypothetical protein GCM10011332_04800 [Terasakiella brassicae]